MNLNRHDTILALLSPEQRDRLLLVQAALDKDKHCLDRPSDSVGYANTTEENEDAQRI